MSGKQPSSAPVATTWTSLQLFVVAVICLAIGFGGGYLLRGSDTQVAPSAQASATAPPPNVQQPPTKEQLRHMADVQAQPLMEQLKSQPNDPQLLAQIGNAYYDAQQYQEAVAFYQKSLNADPKDPNVRTDMGTAFYYMGDADRALAEFNTALKYRPNHPNTLFNMGMIRWQGKMDVAGAVAAWQKLLDTNPDYPERAKVADLIAKAKQHSNIKPGTKTDKPATM
jgi:cytochrome c-type biogenesis protein CcmH/NrfG